MTKVKRYSAALTHAETSPMYEASDGEWVVAVEFDRVTAERDALQQRLNAADQRNDELESGKGLSREAASTLRGMVEYCLNHRVCMGMDEGFKSFDPEEEHDFVKELRAFSESAPSLP